MKKIKKFAVAGVGFGDIIILIEDILKNDKSLKFLGFIDDKKNKNINLKNYKIIGSWKGMKNKNIHTSVHYRPLHLFTQFKDESKFPVANAEWIRMITLPCQLNMTDEDIEGKDVHHKDNDPLNNDKKNLSVVTQHYNRREPRLRDREEDNG